MSYNMNATIDGSGVSAAISGLISELSKLDSKAKDVGSSLDKMGKVKVDANLDGLTGSLEKLSGSFRSAGQELGQSLAQGATSSFGALGSAASGLASALGPVGTVGLVAAAGITALGAAAVGAAKQWESMRTSIGRTTGLEGANLDSLMKDLQGLRQEMGVTRESAASLVEQAGSIGVGQSKLDKGDVVGYKEEILDFARATATLQGAWGMSAEATSSGIGKMGSVTLGVWNKQREEAGKSALSWSDYAYKVGGQVDALANAMGSSEEEIVTAMRNSSGAVAKWAPSEESYGKWQAMASFLIDTGDSAGEAGTKIERVSQKMDENLGDVASIMGIDQGALRERLNTDFMGTIQDLGATIAQMPVSQRPDLTKLFGLEGKGLMDKVIADAEQGTGRLQKAFNIAANPTDVKSGWQNVADDAVTQFSRVGQALQVSLEDIGGIILPTVSAAAGGIASAWTGVNAAGEAAFGAIVNSAGYQSLANLGGTITSSLSGIGGAIAGPLGELGSAVNGLFGGDALGTTMDALTLPLSVALDLINEIVSAYGEMGTAAASAAGGGISAIASAINQISDKLKVAKAYLQAFGEVSGISKFGEGLVDGLEKAVEVVTKIKDGLAEAGPKVADGLSDAFGTLGNKLSGIIDQLISDIKSKLPTALQDVDVGGAAVGILDSTGITSFVNDVSARANELLAPSVQTATAEGMTEGTSDAQANVKDSIKTAVSEGAEEGFRVWSTSDQSSPDIFTQIKDENVFRDALGEAYQYRTEYQLRSGSLNEDASVRVILDKNGSAVYKADLNSTTQDGVKQAYAPIVTNMGKYISTQGDAISNSLQEALTDGVIRFEEKAQLEEYLKQIEDLELKYPDMDLSGLSTTKQNITDALSGIDVSIDVSAKLIWEDWTSAAYREKFLADNPDIAMTMTPGEGQAMTNFVGKLGDKADEGDKQAEEAMASWSYFMDSWRDGTISSMGVATEAVNDILAYAPELGKSGTWFREMMSGFWQDVQEGWVKIEEPTYYPWLYDPRMEGSIGGNMWTADKSQDIAAYTDDTARNTNEVADSTAKTADGVDKTTSSVNAVKTDTQASALANAQTAISTAGSLAAIQGVDGSIETTNSLMAVAVGHLAAIEGGIGAIQSSNTYNYYGGSSNTKKTAGGATYIDPGALSNRNVAYAKDVKTSLIASGAAYAGGGFVTQEGVAWVHKDEYIVPASDLADESEKIKYVSDRWGEGYRDNIVIHPPDSGFQSSAKRGNVPAFYDEEAPVEMFTNRSVYEILGIYDEVRAMQAKYSGKSSVMPSDDLLNPMVVTYADQLQSNTKVLTVQEQLEKKYSYVKEDNIRQALISSEMTKRKTADDGEYCEAISSLAIKMEETDNLWYDTFFGSTEDYRAALEKGYIVTSQNADKFTKTESGIKNLQTGEYVSGPYASQTAQTSALWDRAVNRQVATAQETTKSLYTLRAETAATGNKLTVLGNALYANTSALHANTENFGSVSKLLSDSSKMVYGGSGSATMSQWKLTEFDQTVNEYLPACYEAMSDWGIYLEGYLARPKSEGGAGFFKEESLGGFEKEFPSYGPYYKEGYDNRGMFGGDKAAETTANESKEANDQLAKIGESSKRTASYQQTGNSQAQNAAQGASQKATQSNELTSETNELVKNLPMGMASAFVGVIATSGLIGGGVMATGGGSSGADWGTYGSQYGGAYGSFYGQGAWSGNGVGSRASSSGWGAAASSGQTGGFGGSQGYGSVTWGAKGLVVDEPTIVGLGEAGKELAAPIPVLEDIMHQAVRNASIQAQEWHGSGAHSMVNSRAVDLASLRSAAPQTNVGDIVLSITQDMDAATWKARADEFVQKIRGIIESDVSRNWQTFQNEIFNRIMAKVARS